jgi:uncharacterized protein
MSSTAIGPIAGRMSPRKRIQRIAWRIGRILVLAYVLGMLVFWMLQTWLIFPGARTQGKPEAVVTPPADAQLVPLTTAGGDKTVALFGKALRADGSIDPNAAHLPTLLWFYGNAMCLQDAALDFRDFRRLGLNVCIPEFLGYGMAGGSAGEPGCYAAADAAYTHLIGRTDIDTHKIISGGWSLGGAVAIDLAYRKKDEGRVVGLIAFSSFTSVADVGRHYYPVVPVQLLLKHRFESERKIRDITVPVLIGNGRLDNIVPFGMSGRLAAAAGGKSGAAKVTRFVIEDASHNDFFAVGDERVFGEMQKFARGL